MSRKLGRNELCWCGSGRKYKHCHLRRKFEKQLPFEAIASAVRRRGKHSTCLHPEASPDTCGKVVSAHTLQRSRVLRGIADDKNHVLTFYPPQFVRGRTLQLHRRGWHQASTFAAFCDQHDAEAFAPLEKVSFSGTREQIFLIAYRAVCWELFQKIRATKSNPIVRDMLDRGAAEETQRYIQRVLSIKQAGFHKGLEDLYQTKEDMDKSFLSQDYSVYETYEVVLEGPLRVAATGAITPNRSVSGIPLQTLHDFNATTEWLSFGVDVGARGISVIFIWRKIDDAPTRYMDEVRALSDFELTSFLVQFFFAHCENTYFSASWWESLTSADQGFLTKLMANANPYYFPPNYDMFRSLGFGSLLLRQESAE